VEAACGQPQDLQTGAVGLLRVSAGGQGGLDELPGLRLDVPRPAQDAIGRLLGVVAVVGRHMLSLRSLAAVNPGRAVGGHPPVLEEDLHPALAGSDEDFLPDKLVEGDIVVPVELDVVVDIHFDLLPEPARGR